MYKTDTLPVKPLKMQLNLLGWVQSVPMFYVFVVVIFLFAADLRIVGLGNATFQTDEVFTSLRANVPMSEALASIAAPGNHVPLYFLAVRLFPTNSEFGLRLMSLFPGLLSIALTIAIVRRFNRDNRLALFVGAVMATSAYHVGLSHIARPYPLLLVCGLLTIYFFLRLLQEKPTTKLWAAFTIASLLAYQVHYAAIFLPMTQCLVLLLFRRFRFMRSWIMAQLVAVLPVMVWIAAFTHNTMPTQDLGTGWKEQSVNLLLAPALVFAKTTVLAADFRVENMLFSVPALLLAVIGVVLGAFSIIRQGNPRIDRVYWLLLAIIPVGFAFALAVLRPSISIIYIARYFVLILPALLILMLLGWQYLGKEFLMVAVALMIATTTANTFQLFRFGGYDWPDWREAVPYLRSEIKPTDGIVVLSEMLPFKHYYPEAEGILVTGEEFRQLAGAEPSLDQTRYERLWVFYTPNENDVREWVNTQKALETKYFNGITMTLIEIPSP
jgi:hypothetical protein